MFDRVDWSASPVGDPAGWSRALRGAVDLVTHTRFPATLLWGPEAVLIYNEGYVPVLAEKHPASLGRPAREVFPEAWDDLLPIFSAVMAGGPASWTEDASVPLRRQGRLTEAYFTFSYSAVRGAEGTIEGVLDIVSETTAGVLDRRREALLSVLREGLIDVQEPGEVLPRALTVLRANPNDFALVEVVDGEPAADALVVGAGGPARPRLVVRPEALVSVDAGYRAFLRAVGFSLAQAYDRLAAGAAERRIATLERRMSETLQRSLLPTPVQQPGAEVAVRYRPSAEQAQIGGDWYDSFCDPQGRLTLVIGDVTGHDRNSAAAMAQVRNLLRGVAWERDAPPSGILAGVDRAVTGLGIGVLASAVVARLDDAATAPTLRWSNAGHPPPVLVAPDGTARLLETEADALLGLVLGERADHVEVLAPGTIVVLYTDGLVERPGEIIDDGFAWLTGFLAGRQGDTAEAIGDAILAELRPDVADDVAVLVLRITPAS